MDQSVRFFVVRRKIRRITTFQPEQLHPRATKILNYTLTQLFPSPCSLPSKNVHDLEQGLLSSFLGRLIIIVLLDSLQLLSCHLVLPLQVVQLILQVGDFLIRLIIAQRILDLSCPSFSLLHYILRDCLLVSQLSLQWEQNVLAIMIATDSALITNCSVSNVI